MAVSSYFHLGSSFVFLRTRHHVIIVHFRMPRSWLFFRLHE